MRYMTEIEFEGTLERVKSYFALPIALGSFTGVIKVELSDFSLSPRHVTKANVKSSLV